MGRLLSLSKQTPYTTKKTKQNKVRLQEIKNLQSNSLLDYAVGSFIITSKEKLQSIVTSGIDVLWINCVHRQSKHTINACLALQSSQNHGLGKINRLLLLLPKPWFWEVSSANSNFNKVPLCKQFVTKLSTGGLWPLASSPYKAGFLLWEN